MGQVRIELDGSGELLRGRVDVGAGFVVVFLVEYSTTRDGLMYGVVQSADVEFPGTTVGADLDDLLEVKLLATQLVDAPISARCRIDGDVLTIKSFNMGLTTNLQLLDSIDEDSFLQMRALLCGRYAQVKPSL